MITLSFLNDRIVALEGRYSSKGIKVKCIKDIELNAGCLVNGRIINPDEVINALVKLRNDKKLKMKKAEVILDSTMIYMRKITVPLLSEKLIRKSINAEFNTYGASHVNEPEKNTDYFVLGKDADNKKIFNILCCSMEREMISSYINVLEKAKVKINRIGVSAESAAKFANIVKKDGISNYVVVNTNGRFVTVFIYIDGSYFYSTTVRTYNEAGSEKFFQEMSMAVSAGLQFSKSMNINKEITKAYVFGLSNEDSAKFAEYLSDLNVSVSDNKQLNKFINNKSGIDNPDMYFYNIYGLIELGRKGF